MFTATDSAAQQFETVFAEFFVKAFDGPAADLDKNGRVSIWEAFSYASAAVRQWFEQHGQLPTERPLLDDNGDGVGREAQNPGPDGTMARTVYLAPETPAAADSDSSRRRVELERQLDDLRMRKASSAIPASSMLRLKRFSWKSHSSRVAYARISTRNVIAGGDDRCSEACDHRSRHTWAIPPAAPVDGLVRRGGIVQGAANTLGSSTVACQTRFSPSFQIRSMTRIASLWK